MNTKLLSQDLILQNQDVYKCSVQVQYTELYKQKYAIWKAHKDVK